MDSIKIESLNKFLELAKEGFEYYIKLKSGLKSSKHIIYDEEDNLLFLNHYIDGSEEELKLEDFMNTNTIIALENGSLYYYED